MPATNARPTTTANKTASKTTTASTSSHPVLLQFTVGVVLVLIASWFANISDDTGNVGVAFFALLWLLWLMNNSGKLKGITP